MYVSGVFAQTETDRCAVILASHTTLLLHHTYPFKQTPKSMVFGAQTKGDIDSINMVLEDMKMRINTWQRTRSVTAHQPIQKDTKND